MKYCYLLLLSLICSSIAAQVQPKKTSEVYENIHQHSTSSSPTTSITIHTAGEYYVTATVDDCSVTEYFNVTLWPNPVFSLGDDIVVESGPVILGVSNSYTSYQWNVPNATSNTLQVNQSGTYILTVTNNYGCTYTDSINVNIATSVDDIAGDTSYIFIPTVHRVSNRDLIANQKGADVRSLMIYDSYGKLI